MPTLAVTMLVSAIGATGTPEAGAIDFGRDIRPILAENCFLCHGPDSSSRKADLRLDRRKDAIASVILPGNAEASKLIQRVSATHPDDRMPFGDRPALAPGEIELLRRWIDAGAQWAPHWSWTPLADPPPPEMRNTNWSKDRLDDYILAGLEANGMSPAPEADRLTLLRRVTFDLAGLPPTPAEISNFLADTDPGAYERVVDRLLASPRFGERWARHWLDLVRYAETCGHEFDYPIPHAWKYRDWVIRAINADVPYDRFVIEQLAGDLVDDPRMHPVEEYDESIIGTGFWFLSQGTHAPVDVRLDEADRIENQVDVVNKAFLGLTTSCARCHDHKFDPITTADYYAMTGFLQSSRRQDAYLDPGGRIAAALVERHAWNEERIETARTAVNPGKPAKVPEEGSPDTFGTFDKGGWNDWFVTGHAFGDAPLQPGQWYVLGLQPRRTEHSMATSDGIARELQGTLRSPTFTINNDRIHLRAKGRGSRIRLIIDGFVLDSYNPLLFEGFIINLDSDDWQGLSMDTHRYHGHNAYLEFVDDGEGWISIDEIRFGNEPEPPWPAPDPVAGEAVAAGEPPVTDPPPIPAPMRVLAITDGTPEDEYIFIRGQHQQRGPVAPRSFIESIGGTDQEPIESGSGRLVLARRILDESNPFPARVMVNRTWHHLFGRGIVPTTDDFGILGKPPSHPELLDHLASDFRTDWSLKRLLRKLVTSSTYRMASSHPDGSIVERDPDNQLLHRMNRRRLQAEAIRDSILAVSGELDVTMYGEPVKVHLTDFMTGRGRPEQSGPLDGDRRRSIYQEVRRNFLSPMMLTFDMPIPHTTHGRRNVSNVPAQGLAMMNDPFVAGQTTRWAERILKEPGLEDHQRITRMYIEAYGRGPSAEETRQAIDFVQDSGEEGHDAHTNWVDLAHVLMSSKEFIFLN